MGSEITHSRDGTAGRSRSEKRGDAFAQRNCHPAHDVVREESIPRAASTLRRAALNHEFRRSPTEGFTQRPSCSSPSR
jgi:hypothetical protein